MPLFALLGTVSLIRLDSLPAFPTMFVLGDSLDHDVASSRGIKRLTDVVLSRHRRAGFMFGGRDATMGAEVVLLMLDGGVSKVGDEHCESRSVALERPCRMTVCSRRTKRAVDS